MPAAVAGHVASNLQLLLLRRVYRRRFRPNRAPYSFQQYPRWESESVKVHRRLGQQPWTMLVLLFGWRPAFNELLYAMKGRPSVRR